MEKNGAATLMNRATRYTHVLAMCLLIAIIAAFHFSPLHIQRFEDRGAGDTTIHVAGDEIIFGGMFSRTVRRISEGKEIARWSLEGPVQSVDADTKSGLTVALQYQDDAYFLLGPGAKDIRRVRLPMKSEIVVAAMTKGRDAWYLAFYEKSHDQFVKKGFPFIFPVSLRFRYGVLRLPDLWSGKTEFQIVYEARAFWHEESSHPWVLRFDSGRNVLYMLNPMAEDVTALDLDSGKEMFRVDTPPGPVDMETGDAGIFIALPEADHIAVLDASTGIALAPIKVGFGVVGLAKIPDGVAALSKYKRRIIAAEFRHGRWNIRARAASGLPCAIDAGGESIFVADGSSEEFSVLTMSSLMSDDSLEDF
jgi:hypothetical protein